jgi:hypothetical protein
MGSIAGPEALDNTKYAISFSCRELTHDKKYCVFPQFSLLKKWF